MKRCFSLWIVILFSSTLLGQVKFEKEKRIKPEEVPASALAFLKNIPFPKKQKWYKEQSQQGKSYELKTKFQNFKYSIEFDSTGVLQDVERTIRQEAMDQDTYQKMNAFLLMELKKYKIQKIQEQFTGNPNLLLDLINSNKLHPALIKKYEIEIRYTKNKEKGFYELLVNENGEIEKTLTIENRPSDNLEF